MYAFNSLTPALGRQRQANFSPEFEASPVDRVCSRTMQRNPASKIKKIIKLNKIKKKKEKKKENKRKIILLTYFILFWSPSPPPPTLDKIFLYRLGDS